MTADSPDGFATKSRVIQTARHQRSRISRIFGALCLLALIWFTVWRVQLHSQIKERLGTIRSAGLPASPQELDQWYRTVPDGDNAALVLTQAFALLRTFADRRSNEVSEPRLLDRRAPWSDETRKLITAYVAMNAEALAKAREGVQRSQCRYPVDLAYGVEADLSHLPELKRLARAGALQAALAAAEGRSQDCAEAIGLMLQLAATLDGEPTITSFLVRDSIIGTAVQTTERALNLTDREEAFIVRLAGTFAHAVKTNSLPIALIGERAMAIPIFRMSWAEIHRRDQTDTTEGDRGKYPPLAGRPAPVVWFTGILSLFPSLPSVIYEIVSKRHAGRCKALIAEPKNVFIVPHWHGQIGT